MYSRMMKVLGILREVSYILLDQSYYSSSLSLHLSRDREWVQQKLYALAVSQPLSASYLSHSCLRKRVYAYVIVNVMGVWRRRRGGVYEVVDELRRVISGRAVGGYARGELVSLRPLYRVDSN